jgi:large subunit ribosomal protein L21e
MAKRQGGSRRKTRHKLQKRKRDRGKVTITRKLQEFNIGDKVRILQEPAVQKGMPSAHFKNTVGKVVKKQGKSYVIEVKDFKMLKKVISAGVHLRKL